MNLFTLLGLGNSNLASGSRTSSEPSRPAATVTWVDYALVVVVALLPTVGTLVYVLLR